MSKTKEATGSLDMRKQNKKELAWIEKRLRQIEREELRAQRALSRRIAKIEASAVREIRAARSAMEKIGRGLHKENNALMRRQAILLGRLSA